MAGKRIYEQIEEAADYYHPNVYQVLTHFTSFEDTDDVLATEFIPVSQAKPNPKLFVVGLLPPSANLTGNLLDRSASVAGSTGGAQDIDLNGTTRADGAIMAPGVIGSPRPQTTTGAANLPDSFWVSYVQMCQRIKADPYGLAAVINAESGFKSGAENFAAGKDKPPVARGLNQLTYQTAKGLGMPDDVWNEFHTYSAEQQLPYVEKYFRNANAAGKTPGQLYRYNYGGYSNPDGSLYANKAAQERYLASQGIEITDANRKKYFKNADYQDLAVRQNAGLTGPDGRSTQEILDSKVNGGPPAFIRSKIDAALAQTGGTAPPPATRVPAPPTNPDSATDYAGAGADNAGKARQEASKTSTKDLNTTELGKKFLAAQRAEILATAQALEAMRNLPPLRFLVNPQSLKVSSDKIVSDGNWTRNGPIVEHWGDGQDKVEFAGKLAAFMAIDANSPRADNETGGSPGLTRLARSYTASYQNFLSLWMLYRNNAGLYLNDPTSGSRDAAIQRLSMVGSMYIYYDGILYIGSFDSFNVTENDTGPHSLEYNIQFTVRATFLLDQAPDPRESSVYGAEAQKFFSSSRVIPGANSRAAFDNTTEQAGLRAEAERQRDLLGNEDQPTQLGLGRLLNG